MPVAVQSLVLLLALGAQAQNSAVQTPPSLPDTVGGTSDEPAAWGKFIHCPCGQACERDLGRRFLFNLGQSCFCNECSVSESEGNLRGSATSQKALPTQQQVPTSSPEESLEWDAAVVPVSNFLYCRCGSLGAGRGCRSCHSGCLCGTQCTDYVTGIYGAPVWCIEKSCKPCR
mmetsp:Transcript_58737/g.110015  ORF Transcript_58737/g.110015 Transcript_58737/m.110015 type:complete len:173 (-) Transcript_58737:289-807(-)